MNRIFLVGCPRSGTTLLQSLLASSAQVISFPESHFFTNLIPYRPVFQRMGIASQRARVRLKEFLSEIDRQEMLSYVPVSALFVRQYVKGFVGILDSLASEQGKALWLEKTPGHLHFINEIERYIPGVKFIHLIRNGTDVVASLYDVSRKYPDEWYGVWSLDDCIRRWKDDVLKSLAYSEKENHILVRYENFVEDPRGTVSHLCRFLNILFEEEMLTRRTLIAQDLILQKEGWKQAVNEPIQDTGGRKFDALFNKNGKRYVVGQLKDVHTELIRRMKT